MLSGDFIRYGPDTVLVNTVAGMKGGRGPSPDNLSAHSDPSWQKSMTPAKR
jgi:hypothetical protein